MFSPSEGARANCRHFLVRRDRTYAIPLQFLAYADDPSRHLEWTPELNASVEKFVMMLCFDHNLPDKQWCESVAGPGGTEWE